MLVHQAGSKSFDAQRFRFAGRFPVSIIVTGGH